MSDGPADTALDGAAGSAGANANAIGRSERRIEDRPLLLGRGAFLADETRPNQLWMKVVRSPVAFGRLLEIDADEARDHPGVVAVWTHDDIADLPQIDFRMTRIEGLEPYRQWCLARDYVRYVGEPVALVLAEDPYAAEDAADLVFVDVEEADPVLDASQAPSEFMPETMPGVLTEPAVLRKGYGDVDAAFAAADHVVEIDVTAGRHSAVTMETRGALVVPDPETGRLTFFGAAKVPHYNRGAITAMLGLAAGDLELVEGHVGGGFGVRGELYPEDVLACHAARTLGRPVKWVEDRREHLTAANHSRDQRYRLRAAVTAEGEVTALDAQFFTDQGGYVRTHGGTVSDLSAALLPGPYRIPAYRVAGHVRLTNKTPAGTYRAPGRFESTFARERLMDAVAARLGLGRAEVRRRNLIPEEAMPFDRKVDALGTPVVYDSGRYADLLQRLEAHVDLPGLDAALAARRARGECAGWGIGYFVEKSGLGPEDLVRVHARADGTFSIVTGAASVGQGVETSIAQICAGTLGIPMAGMEVIHGQTARIEQGMGAFATRVTVMTGSATKLACEALAAQAVARAAELLGAPADTLRFSGGAVLGGPAPLTLARLAEEAGGELVAEGRFATSHMTYPYGIHFAQVRVDRDSGGVEIERYVVAYDIGRAINPVLVEGQIVGGVAQGVGGALLEEFVYDAAGQPLAASFADYLVPTAMEMPAVEVILREDAPSPINPLGVKGAGEGGVNGSGAAIAGAVEDALGGAVQIDRLPITPERLFRWRRMAAA